MSNNLYSLDGIQTELKKKISCASALLDAWKKVTFPTKKDGTPFKVMSKNFSGATYRSWEYAFRPQYEHELTVCAWTKYNGYVTDIVSLHEVARYVKDPEKLAKIELNRSPHEDLLEDLYVFDLDDAKKAVAARVEYLEKRVAALEKELEISGTVYDVFKEAHAAAIDALSKSAVIDGHTDLFYMVRDTIQR